MATSRICSIEECDKPSKSYGWCNSHYERWRKHGDPLKSRSGAKLSTRPGAAREFYENVVLPYDGDDCLIWPFTRSDNGYGAWNTDRDKIGVTIVSRRLCIEVYGPPPSPDHQAAHSCGRGSHGCVTKNHLSWKTRVDNDADKIVHGTTNRGERCASAKLTAADVRAIRDMPGTHKEIAKRFGVSHGAIQAIKARTRWAWLD